MIAALDPAIEASLVRLAMHQSELAALEGDPPFGAVLTTRTGQSWPHVDPPIGATEIVQRANHRVELRGGILAAECAAQIESARTAAAAIPD
jgi:tRNA(Arg) A34 adenosine deaminase TadA